MFYHAMSNVTSARFPGGASLFFLGAALARHTGQEEGEAVSHMWSRMGILLQRGNAAILGNRIPALPGALIDGII